MRTHLYSTFVDLTKAFDTVNREGLWKIMQKFGCPERFTQMVRQLHDGMMARVTDNGAVSEAFAVTNGVKQGCVLAPTHFSLMFSAMLMDAYRDERPGIRIAYRTDGHLLNQRRMHFKSRVSTTTVHELLFDDDCALNTTSEEEMQRSMDLFSAACENFGLVINTQKTVPYEKLEKALVKRVSMTEERRLRQLLTAKELGDQKLSQLLRRVQKLVVERKFEASILRQLFLQRLPLDVLTVLAVSQANMEELAELADKVMTLRVTETHSPHLDLHSPLAPLTAAAPARHLSAPINDGYNGSMTELEEVYREATVRQFIGAASGSGDWFGSDDADETEGSTTPAIT
nr:unnamed protein product [Spirometra erinaceieuropaei]